MAKSAPRVGIPDTKIIAEETTIKNPLFRIKVTHPCLRRRDKPSTDSSILNVITDFAEFDIYEEKDGWYRLEDNSWIMSQFCQKVSNPSL